VIGEPVDMRARRNDFDAARAAARAVLKLPPDADVIGWVGRFAAQKDPRTLADVVSRVLLERHNAYAVLVGDGPDRALVESLLRPEAAERRVRFTGERDDVRELYPAFDVLLHTSRWEGHPRVVREALAERVPVVTARVAGTDVVSSDIRFGIEVEPGNVGAFVDALATILDSGYRRAPIDDAALAPLRASADEPYRLTRELYDTALAQARREHP
jgi:glycosyltransferase involved in cell wall biosynthesis